ncbi:unnamed protein product [Timema podura]|uniref:Saccharopine dehydrogenase-like C-terminal domain-containing protein n=1 Tax=Timema podura TaxID=61482 RepID=A0ABN7NZT8_TIMPD|nr:unnamed protein product [Timema podura]
MYQEIIIPGGGQLMKEAHKLKFLPGFNLEGFPNRDSTHYASLYKIANEAHTVLRGTLRFQGFCDTVQGMQSLGLFDTNPHPALHPKGPEITWRQLVCNLLGQSDSTIFYENLKRQLLERVGGSGTFRVEALESLGLLEDIHVIKLNTPLDTLSHFLSKRLAMEPHDRDLVILTHEIGILWPDGRRELRGIHLVSYGEPGCTAMSRAVGIPTAIAAKMVLDGEIQKKGMVLPFTPDIYRPMLSRLKTEGLAATEKSSGSVRLSACLEGRVVVRYDLPRGVQHRNKRPFVSLPEYLTTFRPYLCSPGFKPRPYVEVQHLILAPRLERLLDFKYFLICPREAELTLFTDTSWKHRGENPVLLDL